MEQKTPYQSYLGQIFPLSRGWLPLEKCVIEGLRNLKRPVYITLLDSSSVIVLQYGLVTLSSSLILSLSVLYSLIHMQPYFCSTTYTRFGLLCHLLF